MRSVQVSSWREGLRAYLDEKNKAYFETTSAENWRQTYLHAGANPSSYLEEKRRTRVQEQYAARGIQPLKQEWQVRISQFQVKGEEVEVDVLIHEKTLCQVKRTGQWDMEEEIRIHRLRMSYKGKFWGVEEDRVLTPEELDGIPSKEGEEKVSQERWFEKGQVKEKIPHVPHARSLFQRAGSYQRDLSVRYAEAWWNGANPQYRHFSVDCTNFVSQCLYAGGAPMSYMGKREKGWWYHRQNEGQEDWSYSWAVAHSLRWYLQQSNTGLKAEERQHASQLEPGDVICYDFDGDGRWQHNAFVVAYDGQREPLVNAHTNNVRHKFWDYRHSYAWTPEIQYKFFHIKDYFS